MSKITNFIDLKVQYPNRYEVTDGGGENLKFITFNPGTIYQEGTQEKAEYFNEIQKNCVYQVNGVQTVEGLKEIYDITIDGISAFAFESLKLLFKPNATNTKKGPYIRLNSIEYIIKSPADSIEIGTLIANEQVLLEIDVAKKTAQITGILYGDIIKLNEKVEEKLNKTDIVNDLATGGADKALSGEMGKKLGEDKQDKTDDTLETNSKKIVGAINEVIPSKYDQLFSEHYFHKLYSGDGTNNSVFEHIFPGTTGSTYSIVTRKIERFGTDDGSRYMELFKTGNADMYFTSANLGTSYIYQQKNIGNITELWVNSSNENNIANRTIVLNEKWDRFQTLVFEFCTIYSSTNEIDFSDIYLETSLLRTNNTATADNEPNDYHLLYFNGQYGYKTVYFRDDKRTIWLNNYINNNNEPVRLKRVIGLNRKVGNI